MNFFFVVNEKEITNNSIDIEILRSRYENLMRNYGKKKHADMAISGDDLLVNI